MFTFHTNGSTIDSVSRYVQFTNAFTVFIGSMEDIGFSFTQSTYSGDNRFENENDNEEILYSVNFLFNIDDDKVFAGMIVYSDTEFLAANWLMELIRATSSSPFPIPTNTTYKTDFIVLSRVDSDTATGYVPVILLSPHMVADIRVSSETDDISQIALQAISKVEALKNMLSLQNTDGADFGLKKISQVLPSEHQHVNASNTIIEKQTPFPEDDVLSAISTEEWEEICSPKSSNRACLYFSVSVFLLCLIACFIRKKRKQRNLC